MEEMLTEEKRLHKKLHVLQDEEKASQEAVERAMGYIHQDGKKISGGMKTNDMMEVEAGHEHLEFGQEKQNEGKKNKRLLTLVRKEGKFRVNYSKSAKVKGKSLLSK